MVMFIYNLKAIYSFFSVERLTSVSGSSFIAVSVMFFLLDGLDAPVVALVNNHQLSE
jgi:uncharacterized MnhB-related membrane protein